LAKKIAKRGEAVMIGILAARFKMGQVGVEDLEQMAATSPRQKMLGRKKVLEAVRDSTCYPRIPKNPPKSYPLYKEFIKLGLKSEVNRNPHPPAEIKINPA
jgi:hypothetical protein